MKLFYHGNSPYSRVVRIVQKLNRINQIENIEVQAFDNPTELITANPLGKIPTLVLDDGSTMIDSDTISFYFDCELAEGKLTQELKQNWQYQSLYALAKGVIDQAVALRMEKMAADRLENRYVEHYASRYRESISRSFGYIEQQLPNIHSGELTLLDIELFVSFKYSHFRHPELALNSTYPKLYTWQQRWDESEIVTTTAPEGGF